jgi:hypothetical protein
MELDKMAMTPREARRALGEMRAALDPAHVEEVEAKLTEAEKAPPAGGPTPSP